MQTAVIKKTRATALALTCLVLSATVFDARAITIRGAESCGIWVKERQEKKISTFIHQRWLAGYLSGIAVGNGKDVLKGTDNESIFLWMDNYCQANPLKDIADGSEVLFLELVKQKKL